MTPKAQRGWGITIIVIAVGFIALIGACSAELPLRLWMAGAGALGLVSGFTTGASSDVGSGTEFVKFLGAGVLVPLVGGVATILARPQTVTETSKYSETLLIEKVTSTVTGSDGLLHPLTVLGSFFVVFALLALLGIIGGALLRQAGFVEIKFR